MVIRISIIALQFQWHAEAQNNNIFSLSTRDYKDHVAHAQRFQSLYPYSGINK